MSGIYLHIPFCKQACHYCDFHFSTTFKDRDLMISAIVEEISLQRNFLDTPVKTVYFGGGTPSILSKIQIEKVLDAIHTYFRIEPQAELTLEANPDDLDRDKIKDFKSLGINRLSIGIQTFHNELLKFMNRAHDSNLAKRSIENCLDVGIDNLNLDLIYGIPGQEMNHLESDLNILTSFNPKHISAYSLTIEPRTVFGNWYRKGKINMVDDEKINHQFQFVQQYLNQKGFEQYEISNYSIPGFESKHNSAYWLGDPYLGIGPSAHSFNGKERFINISNNTKYIHSIMNNDPDYREKEELSEVNRINEYILTRLRTKWGLEMTKLSPDVIQKLQNFEQTGMAQLKNNCWTLTNEGMLLADHITSELFL